MPKLTNSMVEAIKSPPSGQVEYADELVRGLRLRVGAGGSQSWIVRTRASGKPINKTLGRYPIISVARAREQARTFLLDVANRGAPRLSRTFGDLAEHWIDNVAKRRNRSWLNQKRRLELHVLPKWRDRKLEDLRKNDIRALVDGLEGYSSPNSVLAIIKTVLRYGVARDWVDHSPAEAIERPKKEAPRDRFLSMAEVSRLLSAAELFGYNIKRAIALVGVSGLVAAKQA